MKWHDGKQRCRWANPRNSLYIEYHDNEWGRPVRDDHKLLEMLILENFQAGLSWECVLNKREAFRQAFMGFNLDAMCACKDEYALSLLSYPGIIHNRLKIQGAINNARIFRDIRDRHGSFSSYLWDWTGGQIIYEQGESHSQLSDMISKDLKKRGMKFVGTTIVYAYLQAIGVIYSHDAGCFMEHNSKP